MPKTEATERGRRLEPDARREQILECAIRVFGERPFSEVSTQELADGAGVARGLLHHYFGSKRELYLAVVKRMVQLPPVEQAIALDGSLKARVDRSVSWYLDVVSEHGKTYAAVTGIRGMSDDPEVDRIIRKADDVGAQKVLKLVGLDVNDKRQRAVIRAYAGLVKATIREWAREGSLTREEAHLLLSRALICIVREVLPRMPEAKRTRKR